MEPTDAMAPVALSRRLGVFSTRLAVFALMPVGMLDLTIHAVSPSPQLGCRSPRIPFRSFSWLRLFARLALALLAVASIVAGCGGGAGITGSGTTAAESRDVEPFSKVRVQGAADIVVAIGGSQSLVVETDDNLLSLLETSVDGDTLRIRFSDRVRQTSGVDVEMTIPALEAVTVDGAAAIDIDDMAGGELAVRINGSATVRASGSADLVEIDVNGAGVLQMFELTAQDVEISISGNGEVDVHATRSLSATLTGSGRVTYEGDPPVVETSVTGSGSIERR